MPILFDDVWVGAGVILRLTGWGYKIPIRIGKTSSDLQEIDLPTISNEDCQKRGMNATMNEICTLDRLGKGACGVSIALFTIFYKTNKLMLLLKYLG